MNAAASLKPYIGWVGCAEEGAVLVFAHQTGQAKRVAFDTLRGWFDCRWTDMRVRRLREHGDWLLKLANQEALAAGRAHAVEDPGSCNSCETWGIPLLPDGLCIGCAEQRDLVVAAVH